MLILRSSPASPFGRKVRIAAAMLGLSERIEIVAADTSDPEDSLRRQNPLGKIPALIGEDALALGQMNYQGARWAAVNTCATHAQVVQYMLSVGSPSVTESGGSCGTQLKFIITDDLGTDSSPGISGSTCTTPTPTSCAGSPAPTSRTFGNPVKIQVNFDATKAIFLYGAGGATSKPWMGLINLPTTLTSTETAMAV